MSVGEYTVKMPAHRAAHVELRALLADQVLRLLRRLGALQRAFAIGQRARRSCHRD